ncbi:nucleotide exchange factor Sil1 [Athalia rosae]|uniref:nucleotide exchange factor Sil1 n=1 Tax=Athalia rosae TaxID=37344 RepID=UPI002033C8EA|nr:nucleotide exchange factor Sil1 [Athalia rosae]
MRCNFAVFAIVSYFLFSFVVGSKNDSENRTVFVPTTEWKTVEKGTPIPKGLHVRHNFQTGITEAKLLEPEEKNSKNDETTKSLTIHPETIQGSDTDNKAPEGDDEIVKISAKELKDKIKKMKASKVTFGSKTENANIRNSETRFQSYHKRLDELKADYESMKLFQKPNDADLIREFIQQFSKHRKAITSGSLDTDELKSIIDILGQLEYLVHDIDSGLEFTKSEGLVKVIYPCLNGTIEDLKIEALRVLGAAVQSNPKVKEVALELEFVPIILRTLTKHQNPKVMDRCIYAMGSLIRNYPVAQKVFLRHGGLEIFSELLVEGPVSSQKRIINLINDMILERQKLSDESEESQYRESNMAEYTDVEFEEKIIRHKICARLVTLLVKTIDNEIRTENSIDTNEHDLLEVIYECILTVGNICKSEFQNNRVDILTALDEVSAFYNSLNTPLQSHDDDFIRHLLTIIDKLKETVFSVSHDEL